MMKKYFWAFEEDGDHYGISIGPFLGGYQPAGSEEPAGGWSWLSGDEWDYANWAVNLDDGVTDQDPRDNTQPNDSGDEEGSQPIMGYGEMNLPVATWGDYMGAVGTYGETKLPGFSYGFVIEYDSNPDGTADAAAPEDAAADAGGELDLPGAAAQLGISEEDLMNAMGDPSDGPPDMEAIAEALGVEVDDLQNALGIVSTEVETTASMTTINGVEFEVTQPMYSWDDLPDSVVYEREPIQSFTNLEGDTHYYEVVYVSSVNLDWYQLANLAQEAGGYLSSITSAEENEFVFSLINDEKFYWCFPEDGDHYGICIGPALGGYQPEGSEEPAGGWSWLSGEVWGLYQLGSKS